MARLALALLGVALVLSTASARQLTQEGPPEGVEEVGNPEEVMLLGAGPGPNFAMLQGTPDVTPSSGSYKLGATKVAAIKCPSGWKNSNKDSDIMLARKLIDAYFVEIARPQLLYKKDKTYGCPGGATYADGDPFFSPAAMVGASKHNGVTVCVPNKIAPNKVVTILAQGVINYHCDATPTRALHVGVLNAKGTYWPKTMGTAPGELGAYGGVPQPVPVSGAYNLGDRTEPDIICPSGYRREKTDPEVQLARKLVDAYFVQIARPKLLYSGNKAYGCPKGASYVDGAPFFSPAKPGETKHNSVSACFPKTITPGKKTYMFAQGVINYHCNDTPTKALHVGILAAQGYYYPTAATVGDKPPQVGGGLGGGKPAITPVSGAYKLGDTKAPTVKCPSGFKSTGKDSDIMLARQLVDAYFAQIARKELLAKKSSYACPKGATYADGDPFFSPASVLLAASKHNSVTACIQKKVTKGKPATMWANGVINYHCNDKPSKALHVAVLNAQGTYIA